MADEDGQGACRAGVRMRAGPQATHLGDNGKMTCLSGAISVCEKNSTGILLCIPSTGMI